MANRVGQKVKMTSLDELLCVPETEGTTDLDIRAIYPFENHPFKVIDDEKMDELVDSIKANGVLTPVIVRPDDEGTYEMISGHRRLHAAERAGLTKIPAIIKEMTNDDAIIYMVDSNVQREEILPSEKAFAYKMRLDAMKRQGARKDLTSSLVGTKSGQNNNLSLIGTKSRSDAELAKQVGESRNSVHRYIRLCDLIPEFLDWMDEKRLPLYTGVEISYFSKEIQKWLYEYCKENGIPKWNEIADLRSGVNQIDLTQEQMIAYLRKDTPMPSDPKKITFTQRKLNQYFPKYMSINEREKIIIELLEQWKAEHGEE